MAYSIAGAEEYFDPKAHIKSSIWAKFNEDQKTAALLQAKRLLSRFCQCVDIEVEYADEDEINAEYAIYEQALHMLANMPMSNADESFAVAQAANANSTEKTRRPDPSSISPDAAVWLTPYSKQVELSRG